MATNHVCTYFEDGDLELACACGERAVLLHEEDGSETLVLLEPHPADVQLIGVAMGAVREEFLAVPA